MTTIVFDPILGSGQDVDEQKHKRLAHHGLMFEGTRYQIRQRDRAFITSIVALASAAVQLGSEDGDLRWHYADRDFAWIAGNNSLVPMDARTALRLAQAALAAMDELTLIARSVKDRIAAGEKVRSSEMWR